MQLAETNVVSLHRKEKKSAVENASAEEHAQQMIGLSQGMLKEVVEALDKIKRVNRTHPYPVHECPRGSGARG